MDGRWSPVRPSGSAGNLATAAISIWSSRAARRIAASRPLPAAGRFGRVGSPDLADRAIFLSLPHNQEALPVELRGARASMACQHPTTPEDPRLCYREIAPNLLNGHSVPLATSCMALSTPAFNSCRCVESGEPPRLFGVEPPRARIEAVRIVDMSTSNAWAEFSGVFRRTREPYLEHENAKTELKALMPEDAKEAIGHGIRAKRSKSGAVSFDVLSSEAGHAALQ
jgi:hypothetical protein